LDTLRALLAGHGIGLSDVRALLLTHIHLDHAGATGSIVTENPEIDVYVHEAGAAHMIDPAKLLASAGRLYGADMDRLWGEFLGVPERNIRRLSGGERITVGDRELDVVYIPGHASHHVGFFDSTSGLAFVGDTAGVRIGDELFSMPPTPPPDIDFDQWEQSIELIRNRRPTTLFITHFGPHEDTDAHLDALLEHLDAMTQMARRHLERAGDDSERMTAFSDEMRVYVHRHVSLAAAAHYDSAAPFTMCWLGLARYWKKRGVGVS
jgi:glyoxylase-like metal-dependent hydrolase (beta-lactamase superfamily II)